MKNNTVVTIGDINYLWGIFLLVASIRKSGMDEPILVGTQKFDDYCNLVQQFADNITGASEETAYMERQMAAQAEHLQN